MKKINSKIVTSINIFIFLITLCFGTIFLLKSQTTIHVYAAEQNNEYSENTNQDFEDDSIIIVLKSNFSRFRGLDNNLREKIRKAGGKSIRDMSELPEKYVKRDGTLNKTEAPLLYAHYKNTPFKQILYVKLIETGKENVLKTINTVQTFEEVDHVGPNFKEEVCSFVPNDTEYSKQWALNSSNGIGIESTWDITRGVNSIRVGIIDSGIGNNNDLNSNVLSGYDFYNDNNITNDPIGSHGTHVAGIVGAIGNNNLGVSGVAPNVKLVPLQTAYDTSNNGFHYSNERLEAINYAISLWEDENRRISILNHSISGFGKSTDIASAISNFPGLFVWAAGNDSNNIDSMSNVSKFELPNLISVGALNSTGQRASFSNYGQNSVKIYAPGDRIYSTLIDNNFGYMSGTSMATPHVSGVAALMLSINPYLSGSQLKTSILNSADTINITVPSSSGGTTTQSVKKLNALKAVKSIDPNTNTGTSLNVSYIEGSIKANRGDNIYLKPSHSIMLVSGTTNTLTAPDIDGYSFLDWQIEGAYPKQETEIKTVCYTKTFTFDESYIRDLKLSYRHFYLYAVYTKNSCIAEGSLITLSNGDQKPVESLTGNESLLVWNMKTGSFDSAPILFIDHDQPQLYEVTKLTFSDGTQVNVIYEHAFWDFNLNKYVFLRSDAAQYIGHWFNKQANNNQGQMVWEKVQLINVTIQEEYTSAWSPVTYGHLCYYVNGMLSMPGATEGLINIFEVDGQKMKYNTVAMERDIDQYGLYTYEEFTQTFQVPYEVFNAFNAQYFKVAIGKGLITEERITNLIERYAMQIGIE